MMTQAIWILGGLAAGYGLLLLLMYLGQSRMIYFPASAISYTPADIGMEFEPVTFTASDSVQLHGWYVPNREARGTLLFQHGNAGNMSGRLETIRLLHSLRLNVFIYDYRGYGMSEGSPDEEGTYRDATAAWNYLRQEKKVPADRIIVMGRSLGGAVAARLSVNVRPAGVILESTFTSVPDLGAETYPIFPVRWLSKFQYDSKIAVREIEVPLLIAHSREDELIPFEHGEKLYRLANEPKRFLEMEGGHNDAFYETGARYRNTLDSFIGTALGDGEGEADRDGRPETGS